jgi:hypothetical protein
MSGGVRTLTASTIFSKTIRQLFRSSISKEVARQSKTLEVILKNQSNAWLKQLKDQLNELPNDNANKAKRSKFKTMIRHTYERQMFERIKETTGKSKYFNPLQLL